MIISFLLEMISVLYILSGQFSGLFSQISIDLSDISSGIFEISDACHCDQHGDGPHGPHGPGDEAAVAQTRSRR